MAARAGDKVLLTPSGYSLRDVERETVVTVNGKGLVLEGPQPTKDADMHLDILGARPDVNVVCHIHGAYITAATTMLSPGPDTLPPLTPGFAYYAYPLPMIPFLMPGAKTLAKTVAGKLVEKKSRAILLQNHGLVTIGDNFREVINIAEEIDEAARIFVLTGGKARGIPSGDLGRMEAK
jgi:ribulose-5-phosphate 4-epimerase/fuculose-1-phosphate aldolase